MVQSLNLDALKVSVRSFLWQPSLLIPQISTKTVNTLDFNQLHKNGIKYLIFDKDNTLTAPYSNVIDPQIELSLKSISHLYPKENIIVVSNSLGTSDFKEQNTILFEKKNPLDYKILRHKLKKPLGGFEALDYFQSKTKAIIHPNEICVIGDRILTDIVYANLNSFSNVHLLNIITVKNDNKLAVLFRKFESFWVYSILKPIFNVKPINKINY